MNFYMIIDKKIYKIIRKEQLKKTINTKVQQQTRQCSATVLTHAKMADGEGDHVAPWSQLIGGIDKEGVPARGLPVGGAASQAQVALTLLARTRVVSTIQVVSGSAQMTGGSYL